jgi:hypothetical protein
MHQRDAVRADYLPKCRANSIEKPGLLSGRVHRAGARILIEFPDQMREHFGVRIGAKIRVAASNQLILKRLIIFDDAIVNQRQLPARVKMRMRVFVIHFAMRRPARMADA